jgi:hypothetical protein
MLSSLLILLGSFGQDPGQANLYTNMQVGLSIQLPDSTWKFSDKSQGTASVLLFSPETTFSTRCTILNVPAALMPNGMSDREAPIKAAAGAAYKRVGFAPSTLAGLAMERLEYAAHGHRTIEFGAQRGAFYFIFQLAAPESVWQDSDSAAALRSIQDSLVLLPPTLAQRAAVAEATPQDVRSRRNQIKTPTQPYEITRHVLTVELLPEAQRLATHDVMTVRAKEGDVSSMTLSFSGVTIDTVDSPLGASFDARTGLEATAGWDGRLQIQFETPLGAGQESTVTVTTSRLDFLETVDQDLVAEIDVVGQVSERSSFSTHVGYYPIDAVNDAAMDITLIVPAGYTAITGGNLVATEDSGDRKAFRYVTDVRVPRLLPFGFAAAKYESVTTESASGLELTIYGYPGEKTLLMQRADVARDSANIFERMMGPLPWNVVRFAHVTPQRKETGVSLPGLVVISDGYFVDFSKVDLSDGALNRPDALSLMVITDELSHQWNFYAVPLSNELAEGVSTFTNLLFIEHRHGTDAYRRGIDFCRDAYFKTIVIGEDKAIADPDIYKSAAYRGVVFCKTPIILDMLRSQLGDDVFFNAWRLAFTQFDRNKDGFDILQHAFSEVSGRNLAPFFEQAFFRPGFPQIAVQHTTTEGTVTISLAQKQSGPPFAIDADVVIRGAEGQTMRQLIRLRDRETIVTLPVTFKVTGVEFDPEDRVLKKIVD